MALDELENMVVDARCTLQNLFTQMDEDGNGTLSVHELRRALESAKGLYLNKSDWAGLMDVLTKDTK